MLIVSTGVYRLIMRATQAASRKARGLPRLTDSEREAKREYDRKRTARKIAERIAWNNALKVERGCADCGYKDHPEALEWDHLPGHQKLHNVGVIVRWTRTSMKTILDEMAKCEVVCANCHRVRTATRRDHV